MTMTKTVMMMKTTTMTMTIILGAGRCHRGRLLRYVEASWQCKRMAIGCPSAVRAE